MKYIILLAVVYFIFKINNKKTLKEQAPEEINQPEEYTDYEEIE